MGKYSSSFRKYYKCPKTQNEARQNQGDEHYRKSQWCRPKRRPYNLANSWDDRPRGYQKSWKKSRRTQYHPGGRGKEHLIYLDYYSVSIWKIEEYLKDHGIPYNMEWVIKPYWYNAPIYEKRIVSTEPKYVIKRKYKKGKVVEIQKHQIGYTDHYDWVKIGTRRIKSRRVVGYNLTWWSDKDIGMDKLIERNSTRV